MKQKGFLAALLLVTCLSSQAEVISWRAKVDPSWPAEDVQRSLQFQSFERLIKESILKRGADLTAYEATLAQKLVLPTVEGAPAVVESPWDTEKRKEALTNYTKLLKSYTFKELKADPQVVGEWVVELHAEIDDSALLAHIKNFLPTPAKTSVLYLQSEITPTNFSWKDLELEDGSDFILPVQKEWLTWFENETKDTKLGVSICEKECANLSVGHLLSINLRLHRELVEGPFKEYKVIYTGGIVLKDLAKSRMVYWADLPEVFQRVPFVDSKSFNSKVASYAYQYPLSKLKETNAQALSSATQTESLTVKLVNLLHPGQAMRFVEWLTLKAAPMQATGRMESFNSRESRLVFHFQGEGNKFKSLVAEAKELESEWGALTVDIAGVEIVVSITPKSITNP